MKNKQIIYIIGALFLIVGAMLIDGQIYVTGLTVFGIGLFTVVATHEIAEL